MCRRGTKVGFLRGWRSGAEDGAARDYASEVMAAVAANHLGFARERRSLGRNWEASKLDGRRGNGRYTQLQSRPFAQDRTPISKTEREAFDFTPRVAATGTSDPVAANA